MPGSFLIIPINSPSKGNFRATRIPLSCETLSAIIVVMICSDNDYFHDVNFDIFYEIIATEKV
jgi:hypothetical protein